MNERELLELAAKAAGIPLARLEPETIWDTGHITRNGWNPLTDDGDAFRLAVKLRMEVDAGGAGASTVVRINYRVTGAVVAEPHYGDDPYAATRRAIVRAAAEIGKKMK